MSRAVRVAAAAVAVLATVVLAARSLAHSPSPADVIQRLQTDAARDELGIVAVSRHPDIARLLVIRVGERWHEVPADRRRQVAEQWAAAWRHAVAQGIVAVVDASTERSLVNFDSEGRAILSSP
jgi:hypothetical protein